MGIKAVLFDLDNTLYDYDRCNKIAERRLFSTIGADFEITGAEAASLWKAAKHTVKERLGTETAASHNRLLYIQALCEQAGKNPLRYGLELYDVYWNEILNNMKPYGYVAPLLEKLGVEGIKAGVVTDLTAAIQYRKLRKLGLADQIDYLTTSEEAGAEKPAAKIFNLALAKMNVAASETLMIGDDRGKDVNGARRVGMRALLFAKEADFYERAAALLGWR